MTVFAAGFGHPKTDFFAAFIASRNFALIMYYAENISGILLVQAPVKGFFRVVVLFVISSYVRISTEFEVWIESALLGEVPNHRRTKELVFAYASTLLCEQNL